MPAARYTDWTHVHVVGDRDAAQAYVPFARKVLGYASDEAKARGYQTYQVTKRLEDGAVVIGEVRGGIPRVTIVPPAGEPRSNPVEPLDDFVVWARDDALPAGIDTENPQQILKHLGDDGWRPYKFNSEIDAGRAEGHFGGMFPAGLCHAGNIDWRGPKDERLSWYGPETRYWMDRFRQPSATYDRFVFLFGKALLDIDAYCTENEIDMDTRLVLGAALDGDSLLVMQAKIDDEETPSLVPFGRAGDTFVSYAYPESEVLLRLYRYKVVLPASGAPIADYTIVPGSHQNLWAGNGHWLVNPWFFSPDGRTLESFSMPATHLGRAFRNASDVFEFTAPAASSAHFTLTLDGDEVALESALIAMSVTEAGATAPVAADYDKDGNRIELLLGYEFTAPRIATWAGSTIDPNSDKLRFYLQAGERQVTLFGYSDAANGASVYEWRWPLTIDLRVDAWAFTRLQWTSDGHVISQWLETRHADLVTESDRIDNEFINGGPPPTALFYDALVWAGATTVAPLFFLTGSLTFGFDGENPNEYFEAGQNWFDTRGSYHTSAFGLSWAQRIPAEIHGASVVYAWEDGAITGFELSDFLPAWADAPADADGHRHAYGFAANDDALLFSGYVGMNKPGSETDTDYHLGDFITAAELPAVTGVAGARHRYHPIWILGKPPKLTP